MAELDDGLARISHLIEDINDDYVQAAYWTRQWELGWEAGVENLDPQQALMNAAVSLGTLHQHIEEVLNLLTGLWVGDRE